MERFRYWASQNKKIVAIVSLILVVWVLNQGWNGLMGVGIYQGYAPEQPIKFSHEIHAGQNKISCVYCHSGVEKSKHANIPSANVCMNCHAYIQQGPTYGTEEIAKIYAALDYNPETRFMVRIKSQFNGYAFTTCLITFILTTVSTLL